MKDLLLTFDHELFLGACSGSVDNCIIRPTELLLEILDRHGVTNAMFFVDTTYLKRLSEERSAACRKDLEKVRDQLVSILRRGHLLFPHLHPHWMDADYHPVRNEWSLSNASRYRMHHVNPETRKQLFSHAITFLQSLQQEAGVIYPLDSFRAGGWCIQPFQDFVPYFLEHNIVNDFSVVPGMCVSDENTYHDFRNMQEKVHLIDEDLSPNRAGFFTEFPVSTLLLDRFTTVLNKMLSKILHYSGARNFGDGLSMQKGTPCPQPARSNGRYREMMSIELLTAAKIPLYVNHFREHDYIQFMSHSKLFTTHNLHCFDRLLGKVLRRYNVNTDYRLMNKRREISVPFF